GALLLLVPGMTEARVLRFEEATVAPYTSHRLRHVGGIDGLGMTDLLGVACYPLSSHILCVVLVGVTGVVVAKVDDRKWSVTRLQGQSFTAVTDAQVEATTGDVVVGTNEGTVIYMRREAPRMPAPKKAAADNGNDDNPVKTTMATTPTAAAAATFAGGQSNGVKKKIRTETSVRGAVDAENTGDESGSGSGGGGGSSSNNSTSGSDNEDEASSLSTSVVREDLRQVVHDLKRNNPQYIDDDDEEEAERPSRWRQQDPKEVVRLVEETHRQHRSVFLDDEAEEDEEDEEEEEDDDGGGADAEGNGARRRAEHSRGDDAASVGATDADGSMTSLQAPHDAMMRSATAAPPVTDYSFQIGATPVGEEGSCYLAYNSVGYIHSTADGTTIHFHDMSLQAVRILERGTILMAALSPVGAAFVLAQEADMDSVDDTPRLTVYYRTFVAIGAQSEWRVRLHPGESVRCLTAGIRYTAVATSRYLRIFSLSGLELAVLSLFPRIVAMVGTNSSAIMRAFKADFDPLAVCYLESGGELRLQVLDVGARAVVVPAVSVPLTLQPD
ncbi:hypothetical protein DQ04_19381000, partial [Trypanosoma grayi]|uniref:hypothetical protein n=1 Tax=Trypanosoma grayi TaxID=71804 RepID=UPI0004F45F8E